MEAICKKSYIDYTLFFHLFFREGVPHVLQLHANGEVQERHLQLGLSDGLLVEVLDGVTEDAVVVVQPIEGL